MISGFSRRGLLAAFSATLIVMIGTLVAKSVGFGKELFVAYELGPGAQLDAFLFAHVFPALLINVFGGALITAFVPQYLRTSVRNSAADASRLGAEIALLAGCAQLMVALVLVPLVVLTIPMLTGGFDHPTQQLTRQLIPILMPLVVLNVISSCWAGMLNAHGHFATVAFVPAITPVVVVVALLVAPGGIPGAIRLALGTIAGALIEFGVLAARTRRLNGKLFRIPASWRPEYTAILRQFWPASASSVLMSATLLVDQAFAAQLPQGSVSTLSYGTRLTNVVATLLVAVVAAVALPAFSRFAAEHRTSDMRRAFGLAVVAILAVSLPLAGVCSFAAKWMVNLLYVRGEFTPEDAIAAASVQTLHAWHIPAYAVGMLAVRGLAAMRATWLMLVGSALNLGTDLIVNAIGVPRYGVAAIGFATTAMYLVSAAFLAAAFLWIVRKPA